MFFGKGTCHKGDKCSFLHPEGGGRKRDPSGKKEQECYLCHKTDHIAAVCPERNTGGELDVKCYACQKHGHISRDCPSRTSAAGGVTAAVVAIPTGFDYHQMVNRPEEDEGYQGSAFAVSANLWGDAPNLAERGMASALATETKAWGKLGAELEYPHRPIVVYKASSRDRGGAPSSKGKGAAALVGGKEHDAPPSYSRKGGKGKGGRDVSFPPLPVSKVNWASSSEQHNWTKKAAAAGKRDVQRDAAPPVPLRMSGAKSRRESGGEGEPTPEMGGGGYHFVLLLHRRSGPRWGRRRG
jgi:hypothetical protein